MVEPGETAEEAMRRELREETGADLTGLAPVILARIRRPLRHPARSAARPARPRRPAASPNPDAAAGQGPAPDP
ncbi:NUDIX domain-containing protein [Actinomadura sp. NTSP31]|uniref:NUDIX domain-containing protein n=1 Tax=Actinomadura sp. NTSP31 TaxID=1735447 RepID=UPI0035C0D117